MAARKGGKGDKVLTPKLDAYLEGVGAEQLNFRRWIVKEHKGDYYTETALITITPEGGLVCSDKDMAPKEEDLDEIEDEISRMEFPHSITATPAQVKKQIQALKSKTVYQLYSRQQKGVTMLQERRETKDGKKYIAWSFWSDGRWRAMEPDGPLTFYKPPKKKSAKIMIHEGPKAAEAAASVKKGHPWHDTLKEYEHWGVIGGALAPHRADYAELAAEQPSEVVYMADNDWPGRSALQRVSQQWARSMKGVILNDDFPNAWDIADPMPKGLFKRGVWVGPSVEKLMVPATQATKLVPQEGRGRPLTVLTEDFKREWVHTIDPEVFVHQDWPSKTWSAEQFNSLVAPYSHLKDTAGHVRKDQAGKVSGIQYTPARPPGLFFDDRSGGSYVNIFAPSSIEPKTGDPAPFLEYMANVFPNAGDREHLLKWVATLIAKPEVRMTYSVLLISKKQGAGKTTLGERIIAPIIGINNASFPRETDISDSGFNGWLAKKRFVLVNEIYAGKSLKAYNILKQIVSDKVIEVNEKFMKGYTVENWAHVVACSNSFRALKIDTDDRRWLIPEVTEKKQKADYWRAFNEWLETDGLSIIYQWAIDYIEEHGHVRPGEHAPATSLREDIAAQSISPGMEILNQITEDLKEKMGDQEFWTTDHEIHTAMRGQIGDKAELKYGETLLDVRRHLKGLGLFVGAQNNGFSDLGVMKKRHRVVSTKAEITTNTPKRLYDVGCLFLNSKDLGEISKGEM